jgi:hypothetical protein
MSRSLKLCLAEYPRVMLEAIAEGWGLTLTDEQLPEIVERLVADMTNSDNVRRVIRKLSDVELAALATVAGAGQTKAHALARKYGDVRHLGPGRLEWEQAWRTPASAVEHLWFLGLLHIGYGMDERFHGKVFFVPPEILLAIPSLAVSRPEFKVRVVPAPQNVRDDGESLARGVFVLLSYLRNGSVRSRRGILSARDLNRLLPRLRHAGLRTERTDTPHAPHLSFLQHMCLKAGLARRPEGLWKPTDEAARWLKQDALNRCRSLYQVWLDDPDWNELWIMPGTRCEDTGWHNDPIIARKAVIACLNTCPANSWIDAASFLGALYELDPDFMRPDGDYDSWYIRDAVSGRYLMGFSSWHQVEGELVRHLLETSLAWLGVVALGYSAMGERADRFMLTDRGAVIMGSSGITPAPPLRLMVRPDLQVIVPHEASWYDRFLLERFARWVDEGPHSARYRIDAQSIRTCLDEGVGPDQILAFLRRAGGARVPAPVVRSVRGWGSDGNTGSCRPVPLS